MCGICGFVSTSGWGPETLQAMNDAIRRRGPDGEGSVQIGVAGLAMRRLAIIDVEGGIQPIYNEDRSVVMVFNGEIYNYKELRSGLIARGHRFETQSDTEVIVHLYEERGVDLARDLEGMFAFAIWDIKHQKLVLGRDRLGIKPLFIAQVPGGVLFASEMKALLATGFVPRELDWDALDAFLTYTFIPAPRAIYRAIRKMEPATTATISVDGSIAVRRYWNIPDVVARRESEAEAVERIDAALSRAVQSHMVSDVPIGAFLSGGVDSGLMVAMMAKASDRPIDVFTVSFSDSGSSFLDERVYARMIAERYGLRQHEITVEPRVQDVVGEIVSAFDEPFADDSVVPSYYVCQAASRSVKVALTGLGGDELFGGYRRHLGVLLGDAYSRFPRWINEWILNPLVKRIPEPKSSNDSVDHLKRFLRVGPAPAAIRYQDSMSSLPSHERFSLYSAASVNAVNRGRSEASMIAPFEGFQVGGSVDRALKTDLGVYLPDDLLALTDRLSMWHSLELRVPFLDHHFVEDAMLIPASQKIRGTRQKHLLKQVASRWLPKEVISHKKQGFEAPMGRWLAGALRPMLEDVLSESAIKSQGIFNSGVVERLKAEHLSGLRKHSKILFSLMMFHLWRAEYAR